MNVDVLEKYRDKKGLTKTELCKKLKKTPGWYSHILSGKIELPLKYVPMLAEIFGIKPDRLAKELFSGTKLD